MKNFTRFHEHLINICLVSKKQLLILIALCISTFGFAQSVGDTFVDDFITYEVTSLLPDEVETIDYNTSGGTVVTIPDTVTYNSIIFDVTSVGSACFYDKQLTSITIGNNIISCGQSAFRQNQLVNVVIPDNVLSIGNYSFLNNQITDIDFGSGITSIPEQSLQNNQFTSITIPDNITDIGWRAFDGNNQLTCMISESTMPPTIFTGTGDSINNRANINLTIPSGTASAYAAATWTGFNSVVEGLSGMFTVNNITYTVTSTTNNTVRTSNYNMVGGSVVNIPATVNRACVTYNVTEIGVGSFSQNNLTSVTIPNSVISIGGFAFADNQNLTSADLHNGITSIGMSAFNNCALSSLNIPTSMSTISDGAFSNNNFTTISIPSNITTIGEFAFRFNSIDNLVIPDTVIEIENLAFNSNSITNLDLGNGVQIIGDDAFNFNQTLQVVTIPASVTSIGSGAFASPALTDVYSEATVPAIITTTGASTDTFAFDRSTIHLHIPSGTMGAYITDPGALWTGFNPVTEDALSVSDFELANDIKVITTSDSIKVVSSNSARLENYRLYNISGAQISSGIENKISTVSFAKGIYILKLDFGIGTVTKKVIIN